MIPVNLQLKNFMSYKNANLPFESFDLAVFSGSNGAGKSTLLEAMTWAVWGKTKIGEESDALIHQGETQMWVEYIFDLDKNRYRIVRKRESGKTGKTTLIYQIASGKKMLNEEGWQNISEATIKETQEKIIKTLHLPYEIFINSSYLQQGKADEFTIKVPSKRKEILAQILNLDYYDKLQEIAKEKRKETLIQKETTTYKIEELEGIVGEKENVEKESQKIKKQIKELSVSIKSKEEKIQKKIEQKQEYEVLKNKIFALREKWQKLGEEIKIAQDEIKKSQQEIEQLKKLYQRKKEISEKYRKLEQLKKEDRGLDLKKDKLSQLKEKLATFSTLKNRLEEDIDKIQHISTCPTCKRKMTSKEAKEIVAKLKEEFRQKYGLKFEEIKKQINQLDYSLSKHLDLKKQIESLEIIVELKQEIDKAEIKIENFQNIIAKEKTKISKNNHELKKIAEEGKRFTKQYKLLEMKIGDFDKLNQEFNELKEQEKELVQISGQLSEKISQIKSAQEQKKIKQDELQKLLEKEIVYEKIVEIFGKNGIQAMIIEQALPAIEEEANKLLSQVSKNLQVKFLTKRTKKGSEEMMETLDIQIIDGLGQRPYELFSGGEAFRINFAIRIAVSQVLSNRSGAKLQFLAIDEGFGTLDQAGKEDLVSAISSIREKFDKIVVITHLEELKEVFPNRVEVTKDEEGSQIHLIT